MVAAVVQPQHQNAVARPLCIPSTGGGATRDSESLRGAIPGPTQNRSHRAEGMLQAQTIPLWTQKRYLWPEPYFLGQFSLGPEQVYNDPRPTDLARVLMLFIIFV